MNCRKLQLRVDRLRAAAVECRDIPARFRHRRFGWLHASGMMASASRLKAAKARVRCEIAYFPLGLHFAERLGLAVGDEHRIVAETVAAARRPNEMPNTLPSNMRVSPVGHARHSTEMKLARGPAPIPAIPRRVLHRRARSAWPSRNPCPDPPSAPNRCPAHHQEHSTSSPESSASAGNPEPCRRGQRLEPRVAFECRLGLFRFGKAKSPADMASSP